MITNKLATRLFATCVQVVDLQQLKDLVKDLRVKAGYEAEAKDLFDLLFNGGKPCAFEKLLIEVTGEAPIKSLSVTKFGNAYVLSMAKEGGVELQSRRCTVLINVVEGYRVPEPCVQKESSSLGAGFKVEVGEQHDLSVKGKALSKLREAISKAEKAKGKSTTAKDILSRLAPECRLGIGRYNLSIPGHEIIFNGFLGNVIVEIVDGHNFKRTVTKASDLKEAIGL